MNQAPDVLRYADRDHELDRIFLSDILAYGKQHNAVSEAESGGWFAGQPS